MPNFEGEKFEGNLGPKEEKGESGEDILPQNEEDLAEQKQPEESGEDLEKRNFNILRAKALLGLDFYGDFSGDIDYFLKNRSSEWVEKKLDKLEKELAEAASTGVEGDVVDVKRLSERVAEASKRVASGGILETGKNAVVLNWLREIGNEKFWDEYDKKYPQEKKKGTGSFRSSPPSIPPIF